MADALPVWIECRSCRTVWIGGWLPMRIEDLKALERDHALCRTCDTPTVLARQSEGCPLDAEIIHG